jgi:hypothetical protein
MIEACFPERRSCSHTITGPYGHSQPRRCRHWAQWRVDGTALCTLHAKPLLEGREAEMREARRDVIALQEAARVRLLTEGQWGFIYVLQPYGVTPAPLKIGFSRDLESLEQRVGLHQESHWYRLEIVGLRSGTVRIEKNIHRQLRSHRIRGEWFWPHADVMRTWYGATRPLAEDVAEASGGRGVA